MDGVSSNRGTFSLFYLLIEANTNCWVWCVCCALFRHHRTSFSFITHCTYGGIFLGNKRVLISLLYAHCSLKGEIY